LALQLPKNNLLGRLLEQSENLLDPAPLSEAI
jgi:hypothetical protein